jgi:hypothetical protein
MLGESKATTFKQVIISCTLSFSGNSEQIATGSCCFFGTIFGPDEASFFVSDVAVNTSWAEMECFVYATKTIIPVALFSSSGPHRRGRANKCKDGDSGCPNDETTSSDSVVAPPPAQSAEQASPSALTANCKRRAASSIVLVVVDITEIVVQQGKDLY